MIDVQNRLRNEFLNTQVITRNTGKRLGVVKEVLVDVDRREIVAFGLRDNRFAMSGIPKYMYLSSVSQTGDVILVESEDVIEDVDIDLYSPLINSEVVTETGETLGKVRDFQFNQINGELSSLIIATLGYPQIPEQMISTYELSIEEIVSSGPKRVIVFEGAQERIVQVTEGVLERLGIGRAPWDKEDEDMYYAPTTPPENQLPTGIPARPPVVAPPLPRREPVMEENWQDEQWEEEQRPIAPPPLRRQAQQPIPYEEEASLEEDVWDDQSDDYRPQRVNIPKKQAMPEYEEY